MKLSAAAGLLGAGALLAAIAALVRWASATVTDDLRGPLEVTAAGSAVAPALLPVAGAALAALGAVLASRGVVRRLVGLLIGVLGVAVGWLGVRGLLVDPVEALLADSPLASAASVRISPIGPILAILGGVCLLVACGPIVTGRVAARTLGARYDRRSGAPGNAPNSAASSADPALAMWKELDAQRDPTLDNEARTSSVRLEPAPEDDGPDGKAAQ